MILYFQKLLKSVHDPSKWRRGGRRGAGQRANKEERQERQVSERKEVFRERRTENKAKPL